MRHHVLNIFFAADRGPQHSQKGLTALKRYLKYLVADDPKPHGYFCSVNLISVQFLGMLNVSVQVSH
jgi:hypothetical protein